MDDVSNRQNLRKPRQSKARGVNSDCSFSIKLITTPHLRAFRLTLGATGVALMLAQSAGSAMAQDAPVAEASQTLPVTPAAVKPDAPATPDAGAGDAAQPDEMATMVAALQKQIIAQQALLEELQTRLAAPAPSVTALSSGTSVSDEHSPTVASPAVPAAGPDIPNPAPDEGQAGKPDAGTTVPAHAPSMEPVLATPSVSPQATSAAEPAEAGREPATASAQGGVQSAGDETLSLTTDAQRQAYASGVTVWREIENSITSQRALGIDLDARYVLAGLQDMQAGNNLRMSPEEVDGMMSALNGDYIRRAKEARDHQDAEGKVYRIAFSRKKGAYSDAGAWYRVETRGTGRHLRTTDMAELLVTGTLPDGTVFDASGQNGQSKTVKVGALLPSLAIGLQKVGVGGHITVVVPPSKGYGDTGLPPGIPGGATLIFEIQVEGLSN